MKLKVITLVLLLAFSLISAQAQNKAQSNGAAKPAVNDPKARAEQILEAARQALGPAEKLKAAREVESSLTGTLYVQGQAIDVAMKSYVQVPDKMSVEFTIPTFSITVRQGINGEKNWMSGPQGDGPLPDKLRESLRQNLVTSWFAQFLTPSGGSYEAISLDDAQVNGKPADVVAVTIGPAKSTLFFDKQSHLLIKHAYTGIDSQTMEDKQTEVYYDDYKVVDGIKVAHAFTAFGNGTKELEGKATEIKINSGIDGAKFAQ